ncbi:MAG: RidA family protein [Pseudomonas sp.]
MHTPDQKLLDLGIQLPEVNAPIANYVTAAEASGLLFLSGQGPIRDGKVIYSGRVGEQLSEEEGYQAARLTALNLLAVLRQHLGSLNRVKRIVKILGWVASAPDFQRQPAVINGASDLLVEVFGQSGVHARSAVSAHVLPMGITVEIEMIVEVLPGYDTSGTASHSTRPKEIPSSV